MCLRVNAGKASLPAKLDFQPAPSTLTSLGGTTSGERSFAVSDVPGTIIGLGEFFSRIAFSSTVVDRLQNHEPLGQGLQAPGGAV